MSAIGLPPVAKPDHVPEDRVVDFDFYNLPSSDVDIQLAYRAFQQNAPDIFWTPHNGGHWVATRAEDIEAIQRDYARFSHRRIVLPKMDEDVPRQLPLEFDPPYHSALRRPLTRALMPKAIRPLETDLRKLAIGLIDGFADRGHCEFVEEFAQILPILIFLDLVGLPHQDRHRLRPITEAAVRAATPEARKQAQYAVFDYIRPVVIARRAEPGDDLLSKLVNIEVDGEKLSEMEAISYATLVLFGGLDTVASMLAFVARFLALNPSHRRQLSERLGEETFVGNAIEELLRRHGIANTAREITHDFEYGGMAFKKGEMILPPNLLYGLDERRVENPLTVDFERKCPIPQATFGNGPHTCPGAVLARQELKVFLQEWLKRIPDFEITPGTTPRLVTGMVNGILELHLSWPTHT